MLSILSTASLVLWISKGFHPSAFFPVGVTDVGYFQEKRTLTIFTTVLKADVRICFFSN